MIRHSLCHSAQLTSSTTSGMICGSKPPPPPQSKKVCVVGAGMAGLAAARELRREGHDVTVLEQGRDVGGQWLYDPRTDDAGDTLVAAAAAPPVKVHSSMYASLRLISARETMSFSDFPFAPREGAAGRDHRRFPGHREVYCYLKDFYEAFALMDAVRLNTRVVRVAMAPTTATTRRWAVWSVHLGDGDTDEMEEVFDAVVVATGHYSQPRLPRVDGMKEWRRRQLHSHSYRVPEPFRGEVVVVVGCGESGKDIAMELRGMAKEVHLAVNSMDDVTPDLSKVLAKHSNLHLHLQLERLHDDGRVVFADGSCAPAVDTVIYCTGYNYSFPFLDTGGAVTVDDNRVGPLFEHVFPPSLAPSLSFVGVPRKLFAPWFFEVQAKWVAQVLSGRRTLPPEAEMVRWVEERYCALEIAGMPKKCTHDVGLFEPLYMNEFAEKYGGLPRVDGWKFELLVATLRNMVDNLETFRDDYEDSDSVREAVEEWRRAKARNQDDD